MTKQNNKTAEIIGWIGVIATLVAYALVSLNYLPTTNYIYQLLNIVGSGSLGIICVRKKAISLSSFYFIWAAIALINLIRFL